ncbi:MAG: arsenical resistance operon transcriptional repressor ArsD [Rhodobacteraceae bacterium]|nr:MAG: arsenical resistance operon transcriptional repressor ArsD [Paracoccaceae bacterium]
MKTVTVYDPAMCCSTGICGAEVDQTLVTFAADLDWLKSQGVDVKRINLSQEPAEFAANEVVKSVLQNDGVEGLPVIILDGVRQSSGRYPARGELAEMAGVRFEAGTSEVVAQEQSTGCCGGDDKAASGCC